MNFAFLLPLLRRALPLLKKYWYVVALAVAAFVIVGQFKRIRYERDQAVLAKNNAEAAQDSLKVKYRSDSIMVYQQLAWTWDELQTTRKQLALKGESKTQTVVTIRPKPVEKVDTVPLVTRDTTVILQDSLAGPPVDVYSSVILQGAKAEWSWLVRPHAFDMEVDVGCVDRLKPDVVVRAPSWVLVDSVKTNVQTKVCGEPAKKPHGVGWWALRIGAMLGAGIGIGAAVN